MGFWGLLEYLFKMLVTVLVSWCYLSIVSILMIDLLFVISWNEASFGSNAPSSHYKYYGKNFLRVLDTEVSGIFQTKKIKQNLYHNLKVLYVLGGDRHEN